MHRISLLVLLALPITANTVEAKIAPIPLAEQVAKADFVGIVECGTAGAIVARYKVIESCRGAKAGEFINIRTFVRYPGPQFRISLCEERYLALALRVAPGTEYSKPGSPIPLSWRHIPADYEIPYGQGPYLDGPDLMKRYEEAKKLVAAQPKAEPIRPKLDKELAWTIPAKPTAAQLDAWRRIVAAKEEGLKDPDYAAAKDGLLAHDPTPFFKGLVMWTPPDKPLMRPIESPYSSASYAAWRCGQDREKHLRMLLNAKEPSIRVVGAVYLCFENEKAGMKELEKLTKLDHEAGGWAALTLGRRGQKDAVPRVLELFRDVEVSNRFAVQLRLNALVLLSNSARKSGVLQPPREPVWPDRIEFARINGWWQEHAKKITLHDPWMETFTRQKID